MKDIDRMFLAVAVESDEGEFLSPAFNAGGAPQLFEDSPLGKMYANRCLDEWTHPRVGAEARIVKVRVRIEPA